MFGVRRCWRPGREMTAAMTTAAEDDEAKSIFRKDFPAASITFYNQKKKSQQRDRERELRLVRWSMNLCTAAAAAVVEGGKSLDSAHPHRINTWAMCSSVLHLRAVDVNETCWTTRNGSVFISSGDPAGLHFDNPICGGGLLLLLLPNDGQLRRI